MKYRYLLFDADDTLFDFPKASAHAFSVLCQAHDIPDTLHSQNIYHAINKVLWAAFDRGDIRKEDLVVERFVRFLSALELQRDPEACNRTYLTALGESVFPFPHAEDVCRTLHDRGHHMYIITNAVASVQRSRLQRSGFSRYFDGAFISEEAGASKPNRAYFEYIFTRIPEITPENTLVIGDSLTTDIQGANNAGLPCCWYNPRRSPRPDDLRIDYEIHDLRELPELV